MQRARDFLLGISQDGRQVVADNETVSEATRLRLIYDILTSPEKSGGADISLHVDPFVSSIFPLHNDNFNKVKIQTYAFHKPPTYIPTFLADLMKEWISTWSKKWMIDDDDLWDIKNQFGEKVCHAHLSPILPY